MITRRSGQTCAYHVWPKLDTEGSVLEREPGFLCS